MKHFGFADHGSAVLRGHQDCAPRAGAISRREILTSLATLSVAAMLPGELLFGCPANAKPKRIDVHHHIVPPRYLSLARERIVAAAAAAGAPIAAPCVGGATVTCATAARGSFPISFTP